MIIKNVIYLFFSFLFFQFGYTQQIKDSLIVKLNFKFDNQELQLNKNYISKNNDTLNISLLKFYISNIAVQYANENNVYRTKNCHLIDIENPKSMKIPVDFNRNKKISKLIFEIGIDSLTNISGALEGDLDAVNGMYWAWQSGYINLKLEGTSKSCKTRKNAFHFHIGGYQKPNYAMREIILFPNSNELSISVDISKIFEYIHLSEQNSIMIPGKNAMKIADYSQKMFRIE